MRLAFYVRRAVMTNTSISLPQSAAVPAARNGAAARVAEPAPQQADRFADAPTLPQPADTLQIVERNTAPDHQLIPTVAHPVAIDDLPGVADEPPNLTQVLDDLRGHDVGWVAHLAHALSGWAHS